jgi:NADPH-dependent curcumin reductase CurA
MGLTCMYFGHVGGKMLDTVLLNIRHNWRIAVCGIISQYNLEELEGIKNLLEIGFKWIHMKGYTLQLPSPISQVLRTCAVFHREKKIVYVEDIVAHILPYPWG